MYVLPQWAAKYVSIYLNDDNLKPEVKNGTTGHAVLNVVQWFILATFETDMPKNDVH